MLGALAGQLYVNCKVCFNPNRVPVSFAVKLKELDRRTP
jgi:hypothetical protein